MFPETSLWGNSPEILRPINKSSRICPFTQYYCTSACAMADVHKKDKDNDIEYWVCGLIKNKEDANKVYNISD